MLKVVIIGAGSSNFGRGTIVDALRAYVADGNDLSDLDEDGLDRYLYTVGLPDPDLIIRTSGEMRLSNFLLWQAAYSEFYFCDKHWPGLTKRSSQQAIYLASGRWYWVFYFPSRSL